jgi:hypothetical protein
MNLHDQSGDSSNYLPPIPMYKRLRKVNLLPHKRVDCSCGCATDMRMPCRHILAVFDESKLIMWHVMWHKAFQTNYARDGQEGVTNVYDNILKDVESQGVSYDGCDMTFLHDSDYPIFTKRSNHLYLDQMKMVTAREGSGYPMTVRARDAGYGDVINITTVEGYDIQTHKSPFAVSGQSKAPVTPTNELVPVFEEMPTTEDQMEESNEQPHAYLQKWFREMDKDFGTFLVQPCFKVGLENARQFVKAEAERMSKGKRVREEHVEHKLNPLDFDSTGLERNKIARRLKPYFEKAKTKK